MNNLEKFLNKQKPARKKKSKLEPFTQNIFFLKNKGYSYQQIIDYLKMEEINVSYTALRSFVIKKIEAINEVPEDSPLSSTKDFKPNLH